jgi:hypothetical protein
MGGNLLLNIGSRGDDNDVHWTATNGDSATITFTGTGIDYIGPLTACGCGMPG